MITSAHGIFIPPRKKKDRPKAITMRFVLTGTIPSKKNRQIATINWLGILKGIKNALTKHKGMAAYKEIIAVFKKYKPYVRQSKDFKEWHDEAKEILIVQRDKWFKILAEKHGLMLPVHVASISIYHYWKDNKQRDNSNKAETIHDLLIDAAIIKGDSWQDLSPIKADADIYSGEIVDHITVIDLTAYRW